MPDKPSPSQPQRSGYRTGVSQPSFEITLTAECPPAAAMPGIDRWLAERFDVKVAPPPAPRGRALSPAESAASAFGWRVLHLAGVLLRAVRIPVFDPGRIVRVQRAPGSDRTWQVVALVPHIDHTPHDLCVAAYQNAARVARWMAGRVVDAQEAGKVFAMLDKFVAPQRGNGLGADSTVPLLSMAWQRRIPFRHLGLGIYQLGWGARQLRVDRGAVQFDQAIGARIAHDKWLATNLVLDAGLPAAVHFRAATVDEALRAARELGWPVVVKPADRERGEGVAVGIADEERLKAAFGAASALSRFVLVERQVPGVCHRIQVIDGEVISVAKRMPKGVRGDAIHTVRQLVDKANADEEAQPPWKRLKPFLLDDLANASLQAAGFTAESVPAAGAFAPLRPIQTSAWGGVVDNMTDTIHPDNVDLAIRAARLFGLAVAGIDVISPDITRPWHENGAIVNEVNYSPLIAARVGRSVIAILLDRWLPGAGRIPVSAVIGGDSGLDDGRRMRDAYAAQGLRAWLVGRDFAESATDAQRVIAGHGLFGKWSALLTDKDVDAVVAFVQDDELLRTGLPVDRLDRVVEAADGKHLAAVAALLRDACPQDSEPATRTDSM